MYRMVIVRFLSLKPPREIIHRKDSPLEFLLDLFSQSLSRLKGPFIPPAVSCLSCILISKTQTFLTPPTSLSHIQVFQQITSHTPVRIYPISTHLNSLYYKCHAEAWHPQRRITHGVITPLICGYNHRSHSLVGGAHLPSALASAKSIDFLFSI